MPEMVSIRKFNLSTTTGHMIHFEAGVPKFVPDEVVPHAMQAGCVPANAVDQAIFDSVSKAKVQVAGELRQSLLNVAIDEMVRENTPRKFDGSGTPKPEELSKRLGFEVFKEETRVAFQKYMSARKQGEEVLLHKDTERVMRAIDAESHADLSVLAMECGLDPSYAAGLKTKDLRKEILSKFVSGVVGG